MSRRQPGKWRDESGSFTIEASLVLPVVLVVTALLLFLCLYIYQKSMLAQASAARPSARHISGTTAIKRHAPDPWSKDCMIHCIGG
ncbi:TadE/TadG family type IV pilus assembly protein [Paenibacillus sp. FSL K6-1566]|uniref:TadE/TadG family type IV pilus assembly protein n=1 Tax=Paenibacillus sp. FSL K6-1566 TaxID=2954515 RepID=UPI0031017AE3